MIYRLLFTLFLIAFDNCLAQQAYHTPIDTSNIAYRNHLKELYKERSAKTLLSYTNFTDKNLRKAFVAAYKELNSEFITKVDNGHFAQVPLYEEQINILINQIVSANPQYSALISAQILLSFAESPNAFALGDGFVVVNIPLLARLENEHELAFIICHEFAHNLLNHPQNGLKEYVELKTSPELKKRAREIDRKKYNKAEEASGLYRNIIYANRRKHREVEFQADSLGFILYKNAFKGKESAALKCLSTLNRIDKEKDSLQPDNYKYLFSSDRQSFKEEWLNNEENNNYKYDRNLQFWQIDSLKTHPDCTERVKRLQTVFNVTDDIVNIPATKYDKLISQAKYDHILGLYILQEYGKSLYETLLLLKDNYEDLYLRKMVHSNLLKIQEAQSNYAMNKYVETVSPHNSGSYNTFLIFLRNLRKAEMAEIINQYTTKI